MSVCFETTCQPRSMDIRELVLLTHPFVLSSFSPASSPPFLSSSRYVIPFIISKLGASFNFISKVRHFFQQPRYVFLLFEGRSFLSISKDKSFLFFSKVRRLFSDSRCVVSLSSPRYVVSSSLKVGPNQGESFRFPGRAAQSVGCPAATFPWSPG